MAVILVHNHGCIQTNLGHFDAPHFHLIGSFEPASTMGQQFTNTPRTRHKNVHKLFVWLDNILDAFSLTAPCFKFFSQPNIFLSVYLKTSLKSLCLVLGVQKKDGVNNNRATIIRWSSMPFFVFVF